jgi:hypothetical protein
MNADDPLGHEKRTMCCPVRRGQELSTIEVLTGLAGVTVYEDGTFDFKGSTDVEWDSSRTIGMCCQRCEWTYVGQDWAVKLIPGQQVEGAGGGKASVPLSSPMELT